MEKTFTIGGTSTGPNGVKQWRFANGSATARAKILEDHDHTDVRFLALPQPMTKEDGIAWLKTQDLDAVAVTKGAAPKREARAAVIAEARMSTENVHIAHEELGRAASGMSLQYWLERSVETRQEYARNAAMAAGIACPKGTFPELDKWLLSTGVETLADGTLRDKPALPAPVRRT